VRIYDRTINILNKYPVTRDSDAELQWAFWKSEGKVTVRADYGTQSIVETMSKEQYLSATPAESIRRCRQEIESHHPELRGKTYELRHSKVNEVVYTKEI